MSFVISATWLAREAYSASPVRSSPYPFIAAPQPAEAETIASGLIDRNESIFFFAILMADSTSPEWALSAPQQPCLLEMCTSIPFLVNTRTVASRVSA